MAQLPIRPSQSVAQGPNALRSQVDTGLAQGIESLARGVSSLAASQKRRQDIDVAHRNANILVGLDKFERQLETDSTVNPEQVEGLISTRYQELLTEHGDGLDQSGQSALADASFNRFTSSRIKGNAIAARRKGAQLQDKYQDTLRNAANHLVSNPFDLEEMILTQKNMLFFIGAETKMTTKQKDAIEFQTINELLTTSLVGRIGTSIGDAQKVLGELEDQKHDDDLTSNQKASLIAQAQGAILNGRQGNVAALGTDANAFIELEDDGNDSSYDPKKFHDKWTDIVPEKLLIDTMTKIENGVGRGQEIRVSEKLPLIEVEKRLNGIDDRVESIAATGNVVGANQFRKEQQSKIDGLNAILALRQEKPLQALADAVPEIDELTRASDGLSFQIFSTEDPQTKTVLMAEQLAIRSELAGLIRTRSGDILGDENIAPLYSDEQKDLFLTRLNNPSLEPGDAMDMVINEVTSWGPTNASAAIDSLFNDQEEVEWNYIVSIGNQNRKAGEEMILAKNGFEANKKVIDKFVLEEIPEEVNALMQEWQQTFPYGGTDETYQGGLDMANKLATRFVARGMDSDDAAAKAMTMLTDQYSIVGTARLSNDMRREFPQTDTGVQRIESLPGSIISAIPDVQYPGDINKEALRDQELHVYTSPSGAGVYIMVGQVGAGLDPLPLMDSTGRAIEISWAELNQIGSLERPRVFRGSSGRGPGSVQKERRLESSKITSAYNEAIIQIFARTHK